MAREAWMTEVTTIGCTVWVLLFLSPVALPRLVKMECYVNGALSYMSA